VLTEKLKYLEKNLSQLINYVSFPPPLKKVEMEWSEGLVLQLIEAYTEHPVLWDVVHTLFKISSLFASFRRDCRKVKCTTSGIGADEVSQSK